MIHITWSFGLVVALVFAITQIAKMCLNKYCPKVTKFIPWILLVVLTCIYSLIAHNFFDGILNGCIVTACAVCLYQLLKPLIEKFWPQN